MSLMSKNGCGQASVTIIQKGKGGNEDSLSKLRSEFHYGFFKGVFLSKSELWVVLIVVGSLDGGTEESLVVGGELRVAFGRKLEWSIWMGMVEVFSRGSCHLVWTTRWSLILSIFWAWETTHSDPLSLKYGNRPLFRGLFSKSNCDQNGLKCLKFYFWTHQ